MSCDPAIQRFFPVHRDPDGVISPTTPFRIVVQNQGDFGTITVDFDAQPALTTGGPEVWRFVGSTQFVDVNAGAVVRADPQLAINENDAVIRAVCRGDPVGNKLPAAEREINVVVVV